MFGAAFGDVVGSPYEFDRGNKSKDFDMYNPECYFTDDTVMTVAVAEALLNSGKDATAEEISVKAEESMRRWGRGYAAEAVSAMVGWAFKQPGVKCVTAETEADNIASQKVLSKAGFIPTGETGEEGPLFLCSRA